MIYSVGAIGIARCFMFAGTKNSAIYSTDSGHQDKVKIRKDSTDLGLEGKEKDTSGGSLLAIS